MKKVILIFLVTLTACDLLKNNVDLVIINANVYTVDDSFSKAQAFAVKKGRFVAVGTSEEIQKEYTANQIVDADGRTITPGLIDAHCHFYALGLSQQVVDLVGTLSFEEVLERVQRF